MVLSNLLLSSTLDKLMDEIHKIQFSGTQSRVEKGGEQLEGEMRESKYISKDWNYIWEKVSPETGI